MIIDLHTHSYYSADGKLSIPELLDFYSAGDIVALTDHETIGVWTEFIKETSKRGIKPVLGVEWFLKNCCHILSYFVHEVPKEFYDFMEDRRIKEKRCMELLYSQEKDMYPSIPIYNELLREKLHPENILGMTVLADAVSKVSAIDFKEAVIMFRGERGKVPDCDKPATFYPDEIIRQISKWNALSFLAHPYKNSFGSQGRQDRKDVEKKIRELANFGIKGIELYSDGSNLEELEHLLSL